MTKFLHLENKNKNRSFLKGVWLGKIEISKCLFENTPLLSLLHQQPSPITVSSPLVSRLHSSLFALGRVLTRHWPPVPDAIWTIVWCSFEVAFAFRKKPRRSLGVEEELVHLLDILVNDFGAARGLRQYPAGSKHLDSVPKGSARPHFA